MASASLQFWSSIAPLSHRYTHRFASLTSLKFVTPISSTNTVYLPKPLAVHFALTEFFFALNHGSVLNFVKLNDAAFHLSSGPVLDECGQELGETLLNLSRAWELADTSTSHSLVKKLPLIEVKLTGSAKSALGKHLVSAGRRFQSMGQYGQGEPQKIAKAVIAAGRALSASSTSAVIVEELKEETRVLKGIQNIPDSSLQYANDNALLLAKSLKGALLAIFYSSTFLSALPRWDLFYLGYSSNQRKIEF
ncbi:hypothetical protein JHK87_028308 [Glycine soja]|nr:hypothetical protein JHK87_028308 [Glycine soja]